VLAQPSGQRGPAGTCPRHVAGRARHHLVRCTRDGAAAGDRLVARCGGGAVAVAARAPIEDEQRAGQSGTGSVSPCRPSDGTAEAKLDGGGGASGGWHSNEEGMGVGRRCAEEKKEREKGCGGDGVATFIAARWGA
jgi:hypothetical protein